MVRQRDVAFAADANLMHTWVWWIERSPNGSFQDNRVMTFRELATKEVREILRRLLAGASARQIQREHFVNRKTAARYLKVARELRVEIAVELTDDVLTAIVARVRPKTLRKVSEAQQQLVRCRGLLEEWVACRLPIAQMQARLAEAAVTVSYSTLRRFIRAMQSTPPHQSGRVREH